MADRQFNVGGVIPAPADWPIPAALEIIPKTAYASFDGTGAAGAYLPCLRVISDSGHVAAEAVATVQVAAGASVDVSWFRGVTVEGLSSGSGVPPFPALDDYVFTKVDTVVTGVGFNNQTNLIIQGRPISLDGATRIKVEFFAPLVEIANANAVSNQAIGFSLWDGATNKGVIGYVEAGNFTKTNAGQNAEFGGPAYGVVIDTPAAGTHTYAVYAFLNVAAGGSTNTVRANTFVDGTGNITACWYRVTAT